MLPNVENEEFLLKPICLEDASFLHRLVNSSGWLENIGDRNLPNVADVEAYITNKILPGMPRNKAPYVIRRKDDLTPLGTVGLLYRDYTNLPDIGYALLPENFGQGIAFRAAGLMMEYGIAHWDMPRFGGMVKADNLASIRILEKLGLKPTGNVTIPESGEELLWFES